MPNGQHLETIADDSVIQPVSDSLHMEAANARAARLRHEGTDSGLLQQEAKGLLELLADGASDLPPSAVPFIKRESGVARLVDVCG